MQRDRERERNCRILTSCQAHRTTSRRERERGERVLKGPGGGGVLEKERGRLCVAEKM